MADWIEDIYDEIVDECQEIRDYLKKNELGENNPADKIATLDNVTFYISDLQFAKDLDLVRSLGITKVLSLEILNSQKLAKSFDSADIKHLCIDMIDGYDNKVATTIGEFEAGHQFLLKKISQNDRVLIHCYKGVSRSSAMMIFHLLKHIYNNNLGVVSVLDVIKYIWTKRQIFPNKHFIKLMLTVNHIYKQKSKNEKQLTLSDLSKLFD
jgi:predicted protein tyrosine phosphatase